MKWSFLLAITCALLSGCGMKEQLDDMHAKTGQMAATTSKMEKKASHMGDNLDQAYAVTVRDKLLESMDAARSMEMKLGKATVYMVGFEFQVADCVGTERSKMLDLYKDALSEFYKDVREWARDYSDTDPAVKDNGVKNAAAMATVLHRINTNQEISCAEGGLHPVSMLGLIKAGMLARESVENGTVDIDSLPKYIRETLKNFRLATYLLKLRTNFLPLMALSQISDMDPLAYYGAASLMSLKKKANSEWHKDLTENDVAEIREWTAYIDEARKTRDFLTSLNIPVEIDSDIKLALQNMKLNDPEKSIRAPAAVKIEEIKSFADSLTLFLN